MLRLSIIVPCRNERKYIETFLASVLAQRRPEQTEWEMLIADGASTDGTREILNQHASEHPWIKVIDNPEGIVPTGLNRAIRCASGDGIIRLDVHAHYAEDYV